MLSQRLSEFSIYLDQRPGEMAGILSAAAAAGVEVTAFWAGEHNGRGLVRIVGEPAEQLRAVCESLVESGIGPVIESEVLAFETEHRPSALRDLSVAMADKRINVRYGYLAPGRGDRPERCLVRVDDLESVLREIESIDWPEAAPRARLDNRSGNERGGGRADPSRPAADEPGRQREAG